MSIIHKKGIGTYQLNYYHVSLARFPHKDTAEPKLTNADVRLLARGINGDRSHPHNPVLDLVGDVWHNLDGSAKVIALALFALGTAVSILPTGSPGSPQDYIPGLFGKSCRL